MISATSYYRCTRQQASQSCYLIAHSGYYFNGLMNWRQQIRINSGMFQIGKMPTVLHYIVKTAFCRPILLQRVVTCQTINDEVIGTTEMRRVLDHPRFMFLEPTPLGVNTLLIWH